MIRKTIAAAALTMTAMAANAGSLDGPYAGLFAGNFGDGTNGIAGAAVGYNTTLGGSFVLGGELEYMAHTNDLGDSETWLNLRAGYALGSNLMAYVVTGSGQWSLGESLSKIGVGAEFSVSETLSLRGEISRQNITGMSLSDGPQVVRVGAFYHF